MPVARAARLCPEAVFVHPHRGRYSEASDRVFAILETFAPVVEPVSIDEAYLDLTGTDRICGPAADAVRALRARIREKTGLPSSAGIGTSKLVPRCERL
jgi:DNA polymerase-4